MIHWDARLLDRIPEKIKGTRLIGEGKYLHIHDARQVVKDVFFLIENEHDHVIMERQYYEKLVESYSATKTEPV